MSKNILVVTACSAKKAAKATCARKLYKSSRVSAVYNRRGTYPMAILSAEHGLVDSDTWLEPYDRILNQVRARQLVPQTTAYLHESGCDVVIYFRGGSGSIYLNLMMTAAAAARKVIIYFGYPNLNNKDVGYLPSLIAACQKLEFDAVSNICPSGGIQLPRK